MFVFADRAISWKLSKVTYFLPVFLDTIIAPQEQLLILVLAVGLSIWGYRGESAKLRTGGG